MTDPKLRALSCSDPASTKASYLVKTEEDSVRSPRLAPVLAPAIQLEPQEREAMFDYQNRILQDVEEVRKAKLKHYLPGELASDSEPST